MTGLTVSTVPPPPMQFFLGTHRPRWLEILEVPLFVSRRIEASHAVLSGAGAW